MRGQRLTQSLWTQVAATLGPSEYRKRAPFCATIRSSDQIDLAGCASQTTMDAEITYAAEAGLNYWAYCWYALPIQ